MVVDRLSRIMTSPAISTLQLHAWWRVVASTRVQPDGNRLQQEEMAAKAKYGCTVPLDCFSTRFNWVGWAHRIPGSQRDSQKGEFIVERVLDELFNPVNVSISEITYLCPAGKFPVGDVCVEFHEDEKTLAEAEYNCRKTGALLPSDTTPERFFFHILSGRQPLLLSFK